MKKWNCRKKSYVMDKNFKTILFQPWVLVYRFFSEYFQISNQKNFLELFQPVGSEYGYLHDTTA